MGILITRTSVSAGGGGGGDWADTFITDVADLAAALATPGLRVGIDVGSTFTGLGQTITSGNGATMEIRTGGSFDGLENAVRLYPPTALVGENAQYAGWLIGTDLWNGGANSIIQMNLRALVRYGPRYFDLAPDAKCWGFQNSTTLGVGQNNRLGVFDHRQPVWNNWKYPYNTIETTPNFHNPPTTGSLDSDPSGDVNKLIEIRGSANHGANPPQTGNEWLQFDTMFDLSRVRGNADGIHRLRVRSRDGLVNRVLPTPLNHEPSWDFDTLYSYLFEGLGFYFNTAGTAHADNWVEWSHVTFAANMDVSDEEMDLVPGF